MEADAAHRFAVAEFGQASLGDKRRTQRLVRVAAGATTAVPSPA